MKRPATDCLAGEYWRVVRYICGYSAVDPISSTLLENMSIRVMLIGGTRVGWVIAE